MNPRGIGCKKLELDPWKSDFAPSSQPQQNNDLRPAGIASRGLGIVADISAYPEPQLSLGLSYDKGKEIGEMRQKIEVLKEENTKLHEKLKTYKKDNEAMNQKIGSLQNENTEQEEIIRSLKSSQEKLQKELKNVKKEKDRLRVEIEEKTSKSSKENEILNEKLEALTNEFEAVEKENKELKYSLQELTRCNQSLQEKVDKITEENKELKRDMKDLKVEHAQICDRLDKKETKLALGQVAWLLESEIWKVVLPGKNHGYTSILKSMEFWLKKNAPSPEGKAAQKRWDALKEKLNWVDEDHKWALKQLKDLRREDAHPGNVDLAKAKQQLNEGGYVADVHKETFAQIIDMLETARELNNAATGQISYLK